MGNKSSKFQYLSLIGIVLLYIIIFVISQLVSQIAGDYFFYVAAVLSIIIAFVFWNINKYYFKFAELTQPKSIKLNITLFIQILIGFFIAILFVYGVGLIRYIQTGNADYLVFKFKYEYMFYMLLPAIGEELIFRATFLNFFMQKNKKYLGLLITGLVFGLLHILNIFVGGHISVIQILSIIFAGFFLGLIYFNFGIITAIIIHYLFNLFESAMILPNNGSEGFLIQFFCTFILCIVFFIFDRQQTFKRFNPILL